MFWCLLTSSFLIVLFVRLCNNIFYFLRKFDVELPILCCVLDDFIQFELALKLTEPERRFLWAEWIAILLSSGIDVAS